VQSSKEAWITKAIEVASRTSETPVMKEASDSAKRHLFKMLSVYKDEQAAIAIAKSEPGVRLYDPGKPTISMAKTIIEMNLEAPILELVTNKEAWRMNHMDIPIMHCALASSPDGHSGYTSVAVRMAQLPKGVLMQSGPAGNMTVEFLLSAEQRPIDMALAANHDALTIELPALARSQQNIEMVFRKDGMSNPVEVKVSPGIVTKQFRNYTVAHFLVMRDDPEVLALIRRAPQAIRSLRGQDKISVDDLISNAVLKMNERLHGPPTPNLRKLN